MKKRYWYLFTRYECPVCGTGSIDKERKYGRKPKKWLSRNIFKTNYDWCNEL